MTATHSPLGPLPFVPRLSHSQFNTSNFDDLKFYLQGTASTPPTCSPRAPPTRTTTARTTTATTCCCATSPWAGHSPSTRTTTDRELNRLKTTRHPSYVSSATDVRKSSRPRGTTRSRSSAAAAAGRIPSTPSGSMAARRRSPSETW